MGLAINASSVYGMAGTTRLASPGGVIKAQTNWPAGLVDLLNDPARTDGWNSWFSGTPSDVNQYAFKVTNSADVNRLIKKLAAVKTAKVRVILTPEKEYQSQEDYGKGAAVLFWMGDQRVINDWFGHLKEESPGLKIFGIQRLRKPPEALPPTLVLYTGSAAMDLNSLVIPENVEVARDYADAYWQEHKDEQGFTAIDGFLAKHPAAREKEEDDIREVVFRYQFEHNQSGLRTNAGAYYLGVGENASDPSDEFMKRFAADRPPVRKTSASTFVSGRGMVDKNSGERGLQFRVNSIKWISNEEAEVEGGYYEASESSSVNTYTVKKANGKWTVTKDFLRKK